MPVRTRDFSSAASRGAKSAKGKKMPTDDPNFITVDDDTTISDDTASPEGAIETVQNLVENTIDWAKQNPAMAGGVLVGAYLVKRWLQ